MAARTTVVFDDAELRQLLGAGGPVYDMMRRIANTLEAGAKTDAPYRTGRLRGSITSAVEVDRDRIVAVCGSTVHYAPHVEYGTRFMRAQPYLRPQLARLRAA